MKNIEQLKFPIGKFERTGKILTIQINDWINILEYFPSKLKHTVVGLSEEQLNLRYRPEGWTIRQVIHHCADSHMNSLIRFKLSLTEPKPIIKPYLEAKWAELPDTLDAPIDASIKILEGVHLRLTLLLRSLKKEDLKKEFVHPEYGTSFSVEENIGVYAWHSNHHLAHIKQALRLNSNFDD